MCGGVWVCRALPWLHRGFQAKLDAWKVHAAIQLTKGIVVEDLKISQVKLLVLTIRCSSVGACMLWAMWLCRDGSLADTSSCGVLVFMYYLCYNLVETFV